MPFDGNGNYKFPINSWNPAINGNQATAQDWQQTINDLATAMSSVVVADGQKMMSGNLRMGNNKVTGLGASTDDTDAVRRAQFKKGTPITSAATIPAPTEGSFFDVNGSVNLEGLSGGYDGQSFVLVFSNGITIKNSERLKSSSGFDIKAVVGHAYNFVRLADDRWFVFDTTRTAESITFKPEGNIASTNVQAAIKELDDEKQPRGNYQPSLGYTPINKSGDSGIGNLQSNGTIHGNSSISAGTPWDNWTPTTRIDSNSIYFQNGSNRFRQGREDDGLSTWVYNGDGGYIGRVLRIGSNQVVSFDKNPTALGKRIALSGDESIWSGSVIQIDTPSFGFVYDVPWGYVMMGVSIQSQGGDSRVYAIRATRITL